MTRSELKQHREEQYRQFVHDCQRLDIEVLKSYIKGKHKKHCSDFVWRDIDINTLGNTELIELLFSEAVEEDFILPEIDKLNPTVEDNKIFKARSNYYKECRIIKENYNNEIQCAESKT